MLESSRRDKKSGGSCWPSFRQEVVALTMERGRHSSDIAGMDSTGPGGRLGEAVRESKRQE